MPRRPARMSPEARAWLIAELRYLAERNLEAAERLVEKIATARLSVAEYPEIGSIGLIPGTRRLVVGAYVLTTRRHGGITEIAGIRHARQGDAYAPADVVPN